MHFSVHNYRPLSAHNYLKYSNDGQNPGLLFFCLNIIDDEWLKNAFDLYFKFQHISQGDQLQLTAMDNSNS